MLNVNVCVNVFVVKLCVWCHMLMYVLMYMFYVENVCYVRVMLNVGVRVNICVVMLHVNVCVRYDEN